MSICRVLIGAWMAAVAGLLPFVDMPDFQQAAKVFTRSRTQSDGIPRSTSASPRQKGVGAAAISPTSVRRVTSRGAQDWQRQSSSAGNERWALLA